MARLLGLALLLGLGCFDTMTERRQIRSCQELAWFAKQIEGYRISHGAYPPGDYRSAAESLRTKAIPLNDEWGSPYRYEVTPDGRHYTLRSAGSDGRFETRLASGSTAIVVDDAKRDIVIRDGLFVQFPRSAAAVAKPAARTLHDFF